MSKPLRALLVDDSEDDVALLVRELRKGGYDIRHERVDRAEALDAALARGPWDLILADYSMPQFNGITALSLARGRGYDGPFILVSGTIGEEVAVQAVKAGANDYVMKTGLVRLVPAVERELREAEARSQQAVAKRDLELSQERFRRLFEASTDGVLLADADGRVLEANLALEAVLGAKSSRLVGKDVADLVPPGDRERIRRLVDEILAGKNAAGPIDVTRSPPETGPEIFQVRVLNLSLPGDAPTLAFFVHNATAERDAQARKTATERHVFVGEIGAYVAHELNTPLANIALLTSSARRAQTPEEYGERLGRIDDQRRRATQIIQDVLRLGQGLALQTQETDLRDLLEEAIAQVEVYRRPEVNLEKRLGASPVLLAADPLQLQQVFVNLLKNALQATANGAVRVELGEDDRRVSVRVADTGAGMAPEVLARLFQPFFTTKGSGTGTGLGLAFSKGIVRAHGGEIRATSELGKGSAFEVLLPKVRTA